VGHFVVSQRREKKPMEKKVMDAMKKAGKPVRPGDVAKMIGAESKEVSKVIETLKKKGKVTSPKRCYYAPAEG
jgi:Mn-dependent DtxR family transcriptional regulator